MSGDETGGGQVEDQTAIHLRVECKVEGVQGLLRIPEPGLFAPSFKQPSTAAVQFIRDQAGHQIDGGHGFGLRLSETGFQNLGVAAGRAAVR